MGRVVNGGDRRASVQFDSFRQTVFPPMKRERRMRPVTCRESEVHVRDRKERRVLESTLSSEGWKPLIFINR